MSFLKAFNIVAILSLGLFSYGQETEDPVEKKIDFIYELSVININEALSETKKLLNIYQENPTNQAKLYLVLVQLESGKGNFKAAIADCEKGLKISKKNYPKLVQRFQALLASCYTATYKYDKALDIYDAVLDDIGTNRDLYLSAKLGFAELNGKINKEKEALKIILEVLEKPFLLDENLPLKASLVLNVCDLYNGLGMPDSTAFYLDYYDKQLSKSAPEIIKSFKQRVQGNISYSNKEYSNAISMYNIYLNDYQDFFQQFDVEIALRKGKAFFELQQFDSTLTVLTKITDQEDYSKKLSKKSLGSFYKLYSDVCKEMGSDDLSDSYFKKYVHAREEYNSSKFKTQEGLYEIKTKEILAEGEQTEKKYKNYIAIISSVLGFLLLSGSIFYVFKTKKDQKRFGELMATVKAYEQKKQVGDKSEKVSIIEELPRNAEREAEREKEIEKVAVAVDQEEEVLAENGFEEKPVADTTSDTSPLKDEKIKELLEKLEKLRETGYFLRQDSSLYNTAKRLKTNTSYLSSVINNTMNTNFNRFVNDIRMDFVILELKNNKRMRSYSVKGIAEEIGYKSADSFTKYFKESTGLSPSAFVRNLNKDFKI